MQVIVEMHSCGFCVLIEHYLRNTVRPFTILQTRFIIAGMSRLLGSVEVSNVFFYKYTDGGWTQFGIEY